MLLTLQASDAFMFAENTGSTPYSDQQALHSPVSMTMKIKTEFPYEVVEHPDMGITMSDGCRLSARVWMPVKAEQEPMPVILEHLPYRKRDGTIVRDQFTHPWFAGHGYVCIRTDIRGNGESEGLMKDEYSQQELADAREIIEWAAGQSWCNGNVGMIGISWGGFNGLQLAYMQPDALKAVVTVCSTVDRYADDIHYKGGCLLGENFGWASNMLSYSSRPPDPALVGEDRWLAMWQHRLETVEFDLSTWLRHQHRDDYWKHGSVCEDYSRITAAVLTVGGWHDGYRNTISHLVENLDSPVKGIVGPWIHKYPHYAAPAPAIGFLQECKRWWDRYLKDIDNGVEKEPAYRTYLMDSVKPKRWLDKRPGRWIAEDQWPSANINYTRFYLDADDSLSSTPGKTNAVISSPQNCGASAGEYFPFAFSDELPDEQSDDDKGSLCYTSDALQSSLDLVGAPSVALSLIPDSTNAQIAVRLLDIRPDGQSALVTYGVLNLTHIHSHEHPNALLPGHQIDFKITLDQIACHIPAGHKLRIALSNAYWPTIWPSPVKTKLNVLAGTLELPVRNPSDKTTDEISFEPPEGATHWQPVEIRPAAYQRTMTTDSSTGVVTISISNDFGENEDTVHGLISGEKLQELWSIHPDDPLSAKVSTHWEQTGGRPQSMWKTEVKTSMHSDETTFYFEAELTATLNGKSYFDKSFKDEVPRDLV